MDWHSDIDIAYIRITSIVLTTAKALKFLLSKINTRIKKNKGITVVPLSLNTPL